MIYVAFFGFWGALMISVALFLAACHRVSNPKRNALEDRLIQARLYNFNRRERP